MLIKYKGWSRCSCSSFSCEERLELVELNLSGTILVNFFDKLFDIDCHLEVLLDGFDELGGIDTATTICLPTHCHVGIQQFSFIVARQPLNLLLDYQVFQGNSVQKSTLTGVEVRGNFVDLLILHLK